MLAYRNPSNEDSDSIFNYTLKLDAYLILGDTLHFAVNKGKVMQCTKFALTQ